MELASMKNYKVLQRFSIKQALLIWHEKEVPSRILEAQMECMPLIDQPNHPGLPKWEVNLVMDRVEQETWLIPKLRWENLQNYKICGTLQTTSTVEEKLMKVCTNTKIWWFKVQKELIAFLAHLQITNRIQLTKHYKISQIKALLRRTTRLRIWRQQDQVLIQRTIVTEYLIQQQGWD